MQLYFVGIDFDRVSSYMNKYIVCSFSIWIMITCYKSLGGILQIVEVRCNASADNEIVVSCSIFEDFQVSTLRVSYL